MTAHPVTPPDPGPYINEVMGLFYVPIASVPSQAVATALVKGCIGPYERTGRPRRGVAQLVICPPSCPNSTWEWCERHLEPHRCYIYQPEE